MTHNMTDYDKTYAEFKWEVPEYFNFAGDVIDKWATQDPNKLAMHWVNDDGLEAKRTFMDFSKASKRLCNVLSQQGVKRGDVVMIVLGRSIEWWEVFTACIRMGVVIAPGTTQLTSKDLEYRVNTSKAVCFITDNGNAPKLDAVVDKCPTLKCKLVIGGGRDGWMDYTQVVSAASDVFETAKTAKDEEAIVYFTSGTVGFPKMALAYAYLLSAGPSGHRQVLAGSYPPGHALEHQRYRLGQGCLEQLFRALVLRRGPVCSLHGPL